MRQKLVAFCTVFFLLLFTAPAMAGVNLSINGKSFVPIVSPQLENGTTMIPLYLVNRVLGAETKTADNAITITKNSTTLFLSLGSTQAKLNGQSLTMPSTPKLVNGEIMVPLRFICEAFDATVSWDQPSQTVQVNYLEERQGMNVEELLVKSSEAMLKYNTYKTRVTMNMNMEMANPTKPAESMKIDTTMDMDLAMQQKPLIVYGKTIVNIPDPPGASGPTSATTEMLINEDGMFMTMPLQEGWLKMNIPGMDLKTLLEQSNSNDPVQSLKMMQDADAIMSFGDDREKDGHKYWVIRVTMGADSFSKLFGSAMGQMPKQPNVTDASNPAQDLNAMMQALFKNIQADMVYNVWVDQTTLIPTFMDLDARIKMIIPATTIGDAVTPASTMSMKETAFYEIYDLGKPFTVPDVSKAMDMNDFMAKQTAATQL